MRKIIALFVLCLPFAFGAAQRARAQGMPDNACVSASYENGNASFTNTCSHNVTIIVTNQHSTWMPGLLTPGVLRPTTNRLLRSVITLATAITTPRIN